ncbi:unnamed protein product, partial [Closterium sp. NIES-54]
VWGAEYQEQVCSGLWVIQELFFWNGRDGWVERIDVRSIVVGHEAVSVLEIWGAEDQEQVDQEQDALLARPESEQLLRSIFIPGLLKSPHVLPMLPPPPPVRASGRPPGPPRERAAAAVHLRPGKALHGCHRNHQVNTLFLLLISTLLLCCGSCNEERLCMAVIGTIGAPHSYPSLHPVRLLPSPIPVVPAKWFSSIPGSSTRQATPPRSQQWTWIST